MLTPAEAADIATRTIGKKHWCHGSKGAWYLTKDEDDNTSGVTWPTPGHAIADMLKRIEFLIVPNGIELPYDVEVKGQ